MGNNRSKINYQTRVGPYRVEEVRIYNASDYPGGQYDRFNHNTRMYEYKYNHQYARDKLYQRRLNCMKNIRQAVVDGRVDILDAIYSTKKLIGYMELNDFRLLLEDTLMYEAAVRNHADVVKWLLDHGVPDHGKFVLFGWKYAIDATTSNEIKNMISERSDINMKVYTEVKELQRSSLYLDEIYLTFLVPL